MPLPRLGILLSGSGTTYANLVTATGAGQLTAMIAGVVSSKPEAGGVAKAKAFGHPVAVARKTAEITAALEGFGAEYLVFCGWMRFFDPPPRWRGKTLNIHPSLLPSFGGKGMYGHHVHEAVLAQGCKVSGCTAHLVQGGYDTGPILAQSVVPVLPTDTPDTLAERVQAAERALYPRVVQALVQGRIRHAGGQSWIEE